MAASEHPARPKPAFVYMVRCTAGPTPLPPACRPTKAAEGPATPGPRVQQPLPTWSAVRTSAAPCGGKLRSKSCPRRKKSCCAAHGARRAGPFPAHKAKTKPGTLSGPDGSQKGPGLFVFAVRAAANGHGAQMPPQNFVQRNRKALPVCPAGPLCVSGMLQNYF